MEAEDGSCSSLLETGETGEIGLEAAAVEMTGETGMEVITTVG